MKFSLFFINAAFEASQRNDAALSAVCCCDLIPDRICRKKGLLWLTLSEVPVRVQITVRGPGRGKLLNSWSYEA